LKPFGLSPPLVKESPCILDYLQPSRMIYPDRLRGLETGKCFAVTIGDAAVMDCDRSAFINIAGVKLAFGAVSYVSFRRTSIEARSWRNRRKLLNF
jgi:hypothetical protein